MAQDIVLNVKSNHMNQQIVNKYKDGKKLQINRKIIRNGFKSIRKNVPIVSKTYKNMSAAIKLSVYVVFNSVLTVQTDGIRNIRQIRMLALLGHYRSKLPKLLMLIKRHCNK